MNQFEPFGFEEEKNDFTGKNIRLNLDEYNYNKLIVLVKASADSNLLKAIERKQSFIKKFNVNKTLAAERATEIRTEKAKKNIKLAFEYLERNDNKITQKAISEASKCSVNTVRKYSYIWKK